MENKEKAIYIVGSISLPRVDAGASRVLELSKGFKKYFDKVIIAGKYDKEPHKEYNYDDKIVFLPYHKIDMTSVLDKFNIIFNPSKFIVPDLMHALDKYEITHILIYSAMAIETVKKIVRIAKKHNIKLVYDVVEFQTTGAQTISSYFSYYIPNIYMNKKLIKNGDNVIAISSYLYKYFKKRGCNTELIPFVFDTKRIAYHQEPINNGKLQLVYAGSPKKNKDYLDIAIKGIFLLKEEDRKKINFSIAGISKEEYIKKHKASKKIIEALHGCITFLGKITNLDVQKLYSKSNFSVLVRDGESRLSMAGFPTKISESLVNGVPIICNLSSDLGNYLKDDYNAIIVNDSSPEEFSKCLLKALSKSCNELNEMRKQARLTSEEKLDVSLFDNQIKNVFN